MSTFTDRSVAAKFDSYPLRARRALLAVRALIFQVAERTPGVGELHETLKWGEPAYLTKNGAGTTVRIDWKAKAPDQYAMYVHCQTGLVDTFRAMFPRQFRFETNRALVFELGGRIPWDALAICVEAALTYHLKMKAKKSKQ